MDARERLLDAAASLMHERGYEAVGVAELCCHAGVKKGSFYHFFPSKQALAIAVIDRTWAATRDTVFAETFGVDDLAAVDAVELYGRLLEDRLRAGVDATGGVNGCRFGNFAVELSTRDEVIRTRVAAVLQEMTAVVAGALRRDVEAGRLRDDVDVDAVGAAIIAHMEGLMVMAKAQRDPGILAGLGATARCLVA